MQEVMRAIIANIAENTTAEDGDRGIPVIEENRVGELVEWGGEGEEEGWRHDETVFVHGEVVVDAVEEEVAGDADAVVW